MINTNPILLELVDIGVEYKAGRARKLDAVSHVSLEVFRGETLGLVGESGCGKSSLARSIMQLPGPTYGKIIFRSKDLADLPRGELRKIRPQFQMIFQDSVSALNPRRCIGDTIGMPLRIKGNFKKKEIGTRVMTMMSKVGLDHELFGSRPHQLSGGQCQRVQIARALITEPELLVCDEPVSSLDVSIQAQIISLLETMRRHCSLTMVFISHDLAVVKNISDRIAVMYMGKICEVAPSEKFHISCCHPYTNALISAVPDMNFYKARKAFSQPSEENSSQTELMPGCRFSLRCSKAKERCTVEAPVLKEIHPGHEVACHLFA